MTEQVQQTVHPKSSVPNRLKKYLRWIALLIVALTLYLTPLSGYFWRVGNAIVQYGFSQKTLTTISKHTGWFKRYFTGPPSDSELIAFFGQHRPDLERAAYFYAHHGYCHHNDNLTYRRECEQLQERTRMQVGLGGVIVDNSIYRYRKSPCGSGCYVQEHYFFDLEPQDWWRSRNREIKAWRKSLVYVPPLLLAEKLGLDSKSHPNDPLELMTRKCHLKASLDSVPPEIEKSSLLEGQCAVRQIEGQWFIQLRPVTNN